MAEPKLFLWIAFFVYCGLFCRKVYGNGFRGQLIQVNGKRVYLKGQRFVLNCTTTTKQFNNGDLLWTKDGKALLGNKIGNNTLQIVKPKVELADSGRYRCAIKQRTRLISSVLIHVSVGDIPSQPTNINWRSVNWRICISWSPVSSTGGFPVTYKVRYRCVTGLCDEELDDGDRNNSSETKWHIECKNTPHYPGKKPHCCLKFVDLFIKYQAVVMATNLFGSSASQPFSFMRDIQTAPSPPSSLKLQADGYGELTLEWTTSDLMNGKTKYAINYNAQGDTSNKTIITDDNGQNYYRITGLRPYTKYTVYLAAIDKITNTVGIPVGPVSIVTREENPSDAPEITQWHSVMYPDNKKLRNVTIYWKLPPKENWNGMLTKYIIQYRRIAEFKEKIDSAISWGQKMIINKSSAAEGTIVGIRVDSAYVAEMQMCNGAGCGGIGNRMVIHAHAQRSFGKSTQFLVDDTVMFCIAFVTVMILCFAVVLIIVLKTKRKQQPKVITTSCNYSSQGNMKAENV